MTPLLVYGSKISYFTGKLEGYLRYKEIPYRFVAMTPRVRAERRAGRPGTTQMPAVELPDGRWMTGHHADDRMARTQHPGARGAAAGSAPGLREPLLEDYADEWLWRPALHYRWSYRGDALLLSPPHRGRADARACPCRER